MKKYLFFILLCFGIVGCRTREEKFDDAFKKSVEWLWSQQDEDGGWHSKTHHVLADGKVLTPYILYYLMQVPASVYIADANDIHRGMQFILDSMNTTFNDSTHTFNYPNYAAAYALRIALYEKDPPFYNLQNNIREYLLKQQFTQQRNVPRESMAYGGWGYGEPDLHTGDFGHVDISHTRRIAEALIEYAFDRNRSTGNQFDTIHVIQNENWIDDAMTFLRSVQRSPQDKRLYEGCTDRTNIPYDGGFVSSMYTLSTNKCQPYNVNDCYHYPSYATATCDGLLALHALGLDSSKEFQDAKRWLVMNQKIDGIDGLSKEDPEQWYQIMHYYHWSVRAEAMRVAGIQGSWEKNMIRDLIKEQQPEGFYINSLGGVNKEDDPLMATIFCIQAFTNLQNI